jgi:hypothetical protein
MNLVPPTSQLRTNNQVQLCSHSTTEYHENHTLKVIMKRRFTSSASMAITPLPTSPLGQAYNSTSQSNYNMSKPYFPAWSLALFAFFGIAAVGVVFCVFRPRGGNSVVKESVREVESGHPGISQHGGHTIKDNAMEDP